MATREKEVELKVPENEDAELEETAEKLEEMAEKTKEEKPKAKPKAKAKPAEDSMTVAVPRKDTTYKGPYVRIILPKLMDDGGDKKVDQFEHVSIANEMGEKVFYVKRGEWVDVPVPVFMVLKARYPEL